MKINDQIPSRTFEPFTFTLTIENKDELLNLLGRLNICSSMVEESLSQFKASYNSFESSSQRLYEFIYDKTVEFNLVDRNA